MKDLKMIKKTILILLLAFIVSSSAYADRRNYVWTYQYMTMPAGATELEFYQTTKLRQVDEWEFRFEVEQGLTDRWDISIYQIFTQPEGGDFSWNAVQLRTRYRLAEEGVYPLDPLIYLEYNRKTDLKSPNKMEAKLILAKSVSQFNLAINPVYELFFGPGVEHELGLDVGISWQFHPVFVAGLESTSRFEFEDGETETSSYLGPTVSFASGNWWYSAGVAFGITDESDDARIRFLMGVGI
jgi:hypothetical protein